MPRINVPDHVENEQAYIRAAEGRIRANAFAGKRKKWLASSPNAQRCIDFLCQCGEFEGVKVYDEDGEWSSSKLHPLVKAAVGSFYSKMLDQITVWGALTEKQEAAVIGMIEKAQERVAGYAAKRAAEQAGSAHIGEVGQRRDFDLTVTFVASFESQFGMVFVNGMKDADGNVVIYKGGTQLGDKGEAVRVKATIKEHSERDGVKQTIIARPKYL